LTPAPDDLLACFPGNQSAELLRIDGTWPTFNRSGDEIADSIIVLDRYGITVDAVAYPGLSSADAGRSLERVNLYPGGQPVFLASLDPSGATPGMAGDRTIFAPAAEGEVTAKPNTFYPGAGGTLQISVDASSDIAAATVNVFDMRGIEVASPGSVSVFPAVVVWDGRTEGGQVCESGFYIVACEFFRQDGSRGGVSRVIVACATGSGG